MAKATEPASNDGAQRGRFEEELELLRQMVLIREFDSRLPGLYSKALIRGSTHAASGQEAVAVGACSALRDTDLVTSTHRGHGHSIAKGASIDRMMAELFARESGYCRGKGGSMHIADFDSGMLGANGIVGGGLGIAAGAALGLQLQGRDEVVVCFFGDGAINQGIFLECGNMAALWKLPVVFLCENNHYAMSARPETSTAVDDLGERARGIGLPDVTVDGMDVTDVQRAVADAVERARSGGGPTFINAECYRFEGHFSGDTLSYRDDDEAKAWAARDPIARLEARLTDSGFSDLAAFEEIRTRVAEQIDEAIGFATAAPVPGPEQAFEDLYV